MKNMKKRFLSIFMVIMMVSGLFSAAALADDDDDDKFTSGSLTYELSDDDDDGREASVERCKTSAEGTITIPSAVTRNGVSYKVNSIEEEAFANCGGISAVVIPSSIREIDEEAFYNCSKLKKITFKGNAPEIDDDAFEKVTATAYYPSGNSTWKESVRKNYGGKITWKASGTDSGSSGSGESSTSKFTTPKLGSISNVTSGIKVKWGKVSPADGYIVYRKTSDTSWKSIAKLNGASKISYTDKDVKTGKTYIYTVRAVKDGKKSGYNKTGLKIKRLPAPSVNAANSATGIYVKWSKVSSASGYYVYRKTSSDGSWSRIAQIKGASNVSYTDKKVSNGRKYIYTTAPYSGSSKGAYISGKTMYRLVRPKVEELENESKLKMEVEWTENEKASGYQLQYAANSSFKDAKSIYITDEDDDDITIGKLTKGKTYSVRVRSYKKAGDHKYYSKWSDAKSVTIRK
ncbi:MAG: leucine-rich repeat protein [Lachnospiraceae bacterium]|nr:leucine-rich repeat protein [Lachnospiraceae bacterium]